MITNTQSLLYFDIETAPKYKTFDDLPDNMKSAWTDKCHRNGKLPQEEYELSAPFHPELSRAVSIGCGKFNDKGELVLTSLGGPDELMILRMFAEILSRNKVLCAHAGKFFDIPFLGKRYLLNKMKVPSPLQTFSMKPWEVPHVDTKDLWSYGQFGNTQTASLEMLCAAFNIPSPKSGMSGMSGKDVKDYFFDGRYKEINEYCLMDVVALARVAQCLAGEDWIGDSMLVYT